MLMVASPTAHFRKTNEVVPIDYMTIICTFDVILLQETWLAQFNCHLLSSISSDYVFYHSSAMEDKLHSGILGGRPFGGTAILVRNRA